MPTDERLRPLYLRHPLPMDPTVPYEPTERPAGHQPLQPVEAGYWLHEPLLYDDDIDGVPITYVMGANYHPPMEYLAERFLSRAPLGLTTPIRFTLNDGYLELSAGFHGMALVEDYAIVKLARSCLTEATRAYRKDGSVRPAQTVVMPLEAVLDLYRQNHGDYADNALSNALQRLSTTFLKTERKFMSKRVPQTVVLHASLIKAFRVTRCPQTKDILCLEIQVADQMYRDVVGTMGRRS
ncbi:hypothetical protein ASF84_25020 [Pseudomonas sp. Leaf127]|uniref:replication initiator protein A n=1 Tax=Pseudomonas sp. Leaf127 TaxID=1736267 RepID=UPI0007032A22|nr:replication initiator protein A [Pseudomonas sp. Leaf127]KQQ65554.1 hypothetical protein ASF84_25020 [Pseudomonas sp. Leaf127]